MFVPEVELEVFDDHRKRFPHYRIAIIYISASEATVRSRIAKRSRGLDFLLQYQIIPTIYHS
jgi:hypothetical protein